MMTCSKLRVTKTKYNKSLEGQRTKGEIKTSSKTSSNPAVILTVILCKYPYKNGI